jgi:hypothetical protein
VAAPGSRTVSKLTIVYLFRPRLSRTFRYIKHSDLDQAALIYDPELNRLLDPYRLTYPLGYECQRLKCRTSLAYWALDSNGARIVPGPERREWKGRVAGIYDKEPDPLDLRRQPIQETTTVGGVADLMFPVLNFEHRFDPSGRMGGARRRGHPLGDQPRGWFGLAAQMAFHLPPGSRHPRPYQQRHAEPVPLCDLRQTQRDTTRFHQVKSQGHDRAVSEKPPSRRLPSMRVVPIKTRRGGNLQ